jgi:hypothetical protein
MISVMFGQSGRRKTTSLTGYQQRAYPTTLIADYHRAGLIHALWAFPAPRYRAENREPVGPDSSGKAVFLTTKMWRLYWPLPG